VELIKTFQFEAAHVTPAGADGGLHGHSYRVEIVVEGPLDGRLGWVMDYAEISRAFDPVYRQIDHQTLNDVPGLRDVSVAGLRAWIEERLRGTLPGFKAAHVALVGEPGTDAKPIPASPEFDLPDRVRFGFEAAHRLPQLPPGHKCATMHGHSFVVEIAGAPIEALAAQAEALYNRLDHRCLNDLAGLENPTSEVLARWIWHELEESGVAPAAVVVAETCNARCIYRGHE
jgi:6-pyruvoyltetrahydropterin/6-carboxytetrahydropterin synthase